MLYKLAAGTAGLWLLGLTTGYTLNGFTHLLLLAALGMVLVKSYSERNREW